MSFFGFSDSETIPLLGLVIVLAGIFVSNYRGDFRRVWSPLTIVAVIFAYYCVLGPYQAVSTGKTYERLVDMRPFYASALWGALISLLAIVIGFNLNQSRGRTVWMDTNVVLKSLKYYGRSTVILGFILVTIYTGGGIANLFNPLDAEAVSIIGGSFANYLSLGINILVPGITFLFAYYIHKKEGLLWFLVPFVLTTGLFITLGFRYRIVLLVGAMTITFFVKNRKKPNLVFAALAIFAFISFMGFINETRTYGRGLDLTKLEDKKKSYYESGLSESLIFQTSGAAIDMIPGQYPYAGFAPIISTLQFPIPRAIFPQKASADYLFNFLDSIYGKKYSKGAAFMMYGEYYLAFGWIGLILGSFLIGWFYKSCWVKFVANSHNPLATVIYAVTVVFLYVIISRGYLPQVTMLYFFIVFPVYFIQRLVKSKYHSQSKRIARGA